MTTTFTHRDLAEALGVSETTIKSYRRKFPGCIPVISQGKPIRFSNDAFVVATDIRDFFQTGMNVSEVRTRLATKYSWINKDIIQEKKTIDTGSTEISQGMSNMAKGMVTMAQQQKTLIKRMQTIEAQLEELGLNSHDFEGFVDTKNKKDFEKHNSLQERLDHLDTITNTLAKTVTTLANKIETIASTTTRNGPQEKSGKIVKIFPKQQNNLQEAAPVTKLRATTQDNEPPREYFSLALIAKTADGKYTSASARGRGRLNINDLKAKLVYGFTAPEHFTMVWELHGDNWQLTIEQPEKRDSDKYTLVLMELATNKENYLEIVQLYRNKEAIHPAEICSIVESLTP